MARRSVTCKRVQLRLLSAYLAQAINRTVEGSLGFRPVDTVYRETVGSLENPERLSCLDAHNPIHEILGKAGAVANQGLL